jgi:hypothetical protein
MCGHLFAGFFGGLVPPNIEHNYHPPVVGNTSTKAKQRHGKDK